jgi:sulfur carrier protein
MAEPIALVWLDGQPLPWRPGLHLAALLHDRGLAPEAVASALNGAFVPRDRRADTPLYPEDRVLTFHPIVGG